MATPQAQIYFTDVTSLGSEISLSSINCTLKLSEVYEGVIFPPVSVLPVEAEIFSNEPTR